MRAVASVQTRRASTARNDLRGLWVVCSVHELQHFWGAVDGVILGVAGAGRGCEHGCGKGWWRNIEHLCPLLNSAVEPKPALKMQCSERTGQYISSRTEMGSSLTAGSERIQRSNFGPLVLRRQAESILPKFAHTTARPQVPWSGDFRPRPGTPWPETALDYQSGRRSGRDLPARRHAGHHLLAAACFTWFVTCQKGGWFNLKPKCSFREKFDNYVSKVKLSQNKAPRPVTNKMCWKIFSEAKDKVKIRTSRNKPKLTEKRQRKRWQKYEKFRRIRNGDKSRDIKINC